MSGQWPGPWLTPTGTNANMPRCGGLSLVFIIFLYRGLANACSGASMRRAYLSVRAAAALISAVACSFGAHAQQQPLPIVGYLSFTSPDERPTLVAAFRQGLQQAGFVVGQNIAIEYRSAGGKYDRLPALAAELVKIPAAVIAATGGEAVARAAKAATSQIPIVFTSSSDVVKGGLVASLNRPGGNVTGVSLLGYELDSKRLQLLRELLPGVRRLKSSWMPTIRLSRPLCRK